jgi:hypothetical protein
MMVDKIPMSLRGRSFGDIVSFAPDWFTIIIALHTII